MTKRTLNLISIEIGNRGLIVVLIVRYIIIIDWRIRLPVSTRLRAYTSHMRFGNFADVRRHNGAQGPCAHALQHPADRQHPHGRGHHQYGPTGAQEAFEQHHAGPATEQAGHEASRQRAERRADPEHRAERLRVLAGHRER